MLPDPRDLILLGSQPDVTLLELVLVIGLWWVFIGQKLKLK